MPAFLEILRRGAYGEKKAAFIRCVGLTQSSYNRFVGDTPEVPSRETLLRLLEEGYGVRADDDLACRALDLRAAMRGDFPEDLTAPQVDARTLARYRLAAFQHMRHLRSLDAAARARSTLLNSRTAFQRPSASVLGLAPDTI